MTHFLAPRRGAAVKSSSYSRHSRVSAGVGRASPHLFVHICKLRRVEYRYITFRHSLHSRDTAAHPSKFIKISAQLS